MPEARKQPPVASDAWMLEQQMRAELEAEAWRRMRQEAALPSLPARAEAAATPKPAPLDPHRTGSTILKALVRFALAAGCAYLAYLSGADSRLGEFEIWLAAGATFVIVLAFSAFNPLRGLVYFLSESMRWLAVVTLIVVLLWVWAAAVNSAPALPTP